MGNHWDWWACRKPAWPSKNLLPGRHPTSASQGLTGSPRRDLSQRDQGGRVTFQIARSGTLYFRVLQLIVRSQAFKFEKDVAFCGDKASDRLDHLEASSHNRPGRKQQILLLASQSKYTEPSSPSILSFGSSRADTHPKAKEQASGLTRGSGTLRQQTSSSSVPSLLSLFSSYWQYFVWVCPEV